MRCARRDADDDERGDADVDVLVDALRGRLVNAARHHDDSARTAYGVPGATTLPGGATTGVTRDGLTRTDESSRFLLTRTDESGRSQR